MKFGLVFFTVLVFSAVIYIVYILSVLRWFNSAVDNTFQNPKTVKGFVEQGIAFDPTSDCLLLCGYMKDHSNSMIFIVDRETYSIKKQIRLCHTGGSPFIGHAGGIMVNGRYVYIAGSTDDCIYIFDLDEILASESGKRVCCKGVFPLKLSNEDGIRASFLGSSDRNMLLVGEFHHNWIPGLQVKKNHSYSTNGRCDHALLVGFLLNPEKPFGLEEKPCFTVSIPDKIQGAMVKNGRLFLSQSFGPALSKLLVFDVDKTTDIGNTALLETELPVKGLLDPVVVRNLPPMTEGLVIVDNNIYVASELSSFIQYHIRGVFSPAWFFSIPLME